MTRGQSFKRNNKKVRVNLGKKIFFSQMVKKKKQKEKMIVLNFVIEGPFK